MKTNGICTSTLVLMLLLVVWTPAMTADNGQGTLPRILITYANESAAKSSVPGRYYRYRSRYQISIAARSDARAVATKYDLKAIDDWPIKSLGVYCVVYEPVEPGSLSALIDRLDEDPRVESVQRMHRFQGMTSSIDAYNDSYVGFQHALRSMNIPDAHLFALGNGVKVAIIDTRIDRTHEDLSNSEILIRDFVPRGRELSTSAHGTAVVSLIGANPNNQRGIVGVAPGAKLIALSACWSEGTLETAYCDSFTLAKAMDFLIQSPPDLINMSIAGPHDMLLGRLISSALRTGIIIVAALPRPAEISSVYPANFPGVIAISPAPAANEKTSTHLLATNALHAPGERIMVALPDDNYDFRSGSSLAAANASGVIALLLEHAPRLNGEQIADILQKSQLENKTGSAVIDACRALAEIGVATACP